MSLPGLYQILVGMVAPQVRLELTTLRLTAECSAIELLRNIFSFSLPYMLFPYVREREKLPFLPLPVDPGNFLLSQAVPSSVPSAFGGLTSVFGMGTGGALQLSSPETFRRGASRFLSASLPRRALSAVLAPPPRTFKTAQVRVDQQTSHSSSSSLDQALDRLVSASSTPHSASTADLSTSSSLRGLTCL